MLRRKHRSPKKSSLQRSRLKQRSQIPFHIWIPTLIRLQSWWCRTDCSINVSLLIFVYSNCLDNQFQILLIHRQTVPKCWTIFDERNWNSSRILLTLCRFSSGGQVEARQIQAFSHTPIQSVPSYVSEWQSFNFAFIIFADKSAHEIWEVAARPPLILILRPIPCALVASSELTKTNLWPICTLGERNATTCTTFNDLLCQIFANAK